MARAAGLVAFAAATAAAQPVLHAYLGSTPTLDGVLRPAEWADAVSFNTAAWEDQFGNGSVVASPADLSAQLWLKHNGSHLFLAVNATDNLLFFHQGAYWLPRGNSLADAGNVTGWPWWGDDIEILLNGATPIVAPNQTVAGNASSWQMALNLHKRWAPQGQLLGVPGVMPSEPRSVPTSWPNYTQWINAGAQAGAVALHAGEGPYPGGSWWSAVWAIRFDPCVQVPVPGQAAAQPWSPALGRAAVGLNIAIQDVDLPADAPSGPPSAYGLRHEIWWAGSQGNRTNLAAFGTLWLEPGPAPRGALAAAAAGL